VKRKKRTKDMQKRSNTGSETKKQDSRKRKREYLSRCQTLNVGGVKRGSKEKIIPQGGKVVGKKNTRVWKHEKKTKKHKENQRNRRV